MGGVEFVGTKRDAVPHDVGTIDSVVVESRRYVLEETLTRDIDGALDDT